MRYSLPRKLSLLGLLTLAALAHATDDAGRLRVGLVLGGGGARGAAHIGVLEVLDQMRVPVDCVAGTSMGALVAGAFAAGLSPAEMRAELAQADWSDMFQDNPEYSELNYRNKALSKRFLPGSETGVGENGVHYQAGVVSGQKIKLFFNRLVRANLGEREIQTLPLPLSIIATDIGSGERVVIRDGSLSKAMRASMSVPGLMAPVDLQGRKLVDGGLVDNLPIGEARSRCHADAVIAVNVGSPLLKPSEVGSLLSVSAQMVNILTEQNVNLSLARLQPADIYLKPELEGISAGDFQRSDETADRGKQAALAAVHRLRALALNESAYSAWRSKIEITRHEAPRIDEIEITGLVRIHPAAVERHIRLRPGDNADVLELNKDLLRAYGDGYYENVDYALLTVRDRNILRVAPMEKSWGPDYLRFGINLDTNFRLDSSYSLRSAYHKTWLNSHGGEAILSAETGRKNAIGIELYQPLTVDQRYFAEAALTRASEASSIYQNDLRLAEYKSIRSTASLLGGMNVGLLGQTRLGWRQTWQQTELETGLPWFPAEPKRRFGGWLASVDFDQMDRLYFPTRGWATRASYFKSPQLDYSKLLIEARGAYTFNDLVLAGRWSYQASPKGMLPSYDAGSLGGFLALSGFAKEQLQGDDIRYAHLRAEKIIGRLPLGLRGDMRLGLALEAGKVGRPYTETQRTGWLNSTTLYVGGETPLGPVYLGFGHSTSGSSNLYLFLGTP